MGFFRWVRANSEHYLLIDAQARIAQRHGAPEPLKPQGLKERFWRNVFAPIYRCVPWSLRVRLMAAMPGSHRKQWPAPEGRPRGPAI